MKIMKHNKQPINEIIENLENGDSTIYVSGTGTGKSFVCMYIIKYFKLKTLYVYPKHAIGKNIKKYEEFKEVEDYVSFCTFNTFCDEVVTNETLSKYDLVVIDECHHLLSEVYGRNICKFMDKDTDTKFLGMTATPSMGLCSCIDKFDKCVEGLSVMDAIEIGLMPTINYNIAIEGFSRDLLKSYLFADYDFNIDIKNSMHILKRYVDETNINKWICFFNSSAQIDSVYEDIEELFKGYKIVTVLSKLNNLDESMEEVECNEKVVILTCTMFTEGMHLSDIGGIFIFRNITSPSLFMQVVGRVCHIGKHKSPVIVDCSRSVYTLLYTFARRSYESLKDNNTNSKLRPLVSITINKLYYLPQYELYKVYEKAIHPIVFRGEKYCNILDLYNTYGLNKDEVLGFQKTYKVSRIEAINSILNRKSYEDLCTIRV